jgi:excisionase family DNA binding protein
LFVRIPTEHARRLDRAAFELRVPKQSLVSELVERYVNPDSPASLMALGNGWGMRVAGEPRGAAVRGAAGQPRGAAPPGAERQPRGAAAPAACDEGSRRRVTVETLDQGELTVGHHSFRPRDPEVLTPEEAAELLQVDPDVVLDLARGGGLPGRELGGEWRFARAALLAWLATGTADGDAKG